jgi:hypothetical protein
MKRSTPRPPENVRAVMADGAEVPVECVYVGRRQGFHIWQGVWPLPEMPRQLAIDALPAKTQVEVRAAGGG